MDKNKNEGQVRLKTNHFSPLHQGINNLSDLPARTQKLIEGLFQRIRYLQRESGQNQDQIY